MPAPPSKLDHYRSAEVAAEYDRRWSGAAGARRNRRKGRALLAGLELLARATGARVRSVLDVPCGTGRFTGLLRERGYAYGGADRASEMLAVAARRFPGARYAAADLGRLPFPDGAFDAAVCIRFLHLVREPEQRRCFLAELARVSRVGVVLDYRHNRTLRVWGRRLRHRLGRLPRAPANPSPAAIRAEVAAAGLQWQGGIAVHWAPLLSDKLLVVACSGGSPG